MKKVNHIDIHIVYYHFIVEDQSVQFKKKASDQEGR